MENRKIKRISLDILKYYKLVTKSLNNCEFFEKSIEKKVDYCYYIYVIFRM